MLATNNLTSPVCERWFSFVSKNLEQFSSPNLTAKFKNIMWTEATEGLSSQNINKFNPDHDWERAPYIEPCAEDIQKEVSFQIRECINTMRQYTSSQLNGILNSIIFYSEEYHAASHQGVKRRVEILLSLGCNDFSLIAANYLYQCYLHEQEGCYNRWMAFSALHMPEVISVMHAFHEGMSFHGTLEQFIDTRPRWNSILAYFLNSIDMVENWRKHSLDQMEFKEWIKPIANHLRPKEFWDDRSNWGSLVKLVTDSMTHQHIIYYPYMSRLLVEVIKRYEYTMIDLSDFCHSRSEES